MTTLSTATRDQCVTRSGSIPAAAVYIASVPIEIAIPFDPQSPTPLNITVRGTYNGHVEFTVTSCPGKKSYRASA